MKNQRSIYLSIRVSFLILLSVLFTVMLTVLFAWFYRIATDLLLDDLRRDISAIALAASAAADGDTNLKILRSGKLDDADYLPMANAFRQIKRINHKAFAIYTYVQLPNEPDQIRFVVTDELAAGTPRDPIDIEIDKQRACEFKPSERTAVGEVFTRADGLTPKMLQGLKEPVAEETIVEDNWGQWLGAYAPLKNSKGELVGAVGVDMCAGEVYKLQSTIRAAIVPAFGLSLAALAAVILLLANNLTSPIIHLTRVAESISQGNYDHDLLPWSEVFVRNELSTLAHVIDVMAEKVAERETKLKARVAELQIIVDSGKRDKQVGEIVESDFFKDLQGKATEMRSRKSGILSKPPADS